MHRRPVESDQPPSPPDDARWWRRFGDLEDFAAAVAATVVASAFFEIGTTPFRDLLVPALSAGFILLATAYATRSVVHLRAAQGARREAAPLPAGLAEIGYRLRKQADQLGAAPTRNAPRPESPT